MNKLRLLNDIKATCPISCLLEVALYAKGTERLCAEPLPLQNRHTASSVLSIILAVTFILTMPAVRQMWQKKQKKQPTVARS